MKILVINGANMNMLGRREPDIYGKEDYAALCARIYEHAQSRGVAVECFQSNHEGAIIDAIQEADTAFDGIVINPGAYTHYSYAIHDALKAVSIPAVEVHMSDIQKREEFRHLSVTAPACIAQIRGLKAALEHSVVQLPSGRELRVSVSGGVAWYPESSTNLITLRKYADFAMYQVKHSRKGELLEFDPEVYRTSLQERRCHEEFRRLINEELVTYHFQPIIDAKDGSVFAYEALMRVDLPTLHSPADVLRLAREENCLHEVERITFFRASSAYQALENAGKVVPSALLFVNSIASQYLTPDELSEYSARYASILPRIVIEITEEEVLDPKALRIKQTIRGSSGAFALDDYGSGYSNERSLLELSPNYIKIDLSIIRDIDTDANKRQIVSNTVSYAHQRGMKVVAEGLETADEVRTVLSLGVDLLQGFFLAMPQVEPGGASEESLAVIAEMHSQSDESQISIFGGDKQ